MLTEAPIMAVVPTTDIEQKRSTARRSVFPTRLHRRQGGGYCRRDRETRAESDVRAAVNLLRNRGVCSKAMTSRN
jgi:hypothetical protein